MVRPPEPDPDTVSRSRVRVAAAVAVAMNELASHMGEAPIPDGTVDSDWTRVGLQAATDRLDLLEMRDRATWADRLDVRALTVERTIDPRILFVELTELAALVQMWAAQTARTLDDLEAQRQATGS